MQEHEQEQKPYEPWRRAARIAKGGWVAGWGDGRDTGCILAITGRVLDVAPRDLPLSVLAQLRNEIIAVTPRGSWWWTELTEPTKTIVRADMKYIMAWNDSLARKEQVVTVFTNIADKLEAEWHASEGERLRNRVHVLEAEIIRLKERIAYLEGENISLWRRLKGIKADYEQVARIEAELAETFERLQAEEAVGV